MCSCIKAKFFLKNTEKAHSGGTCRSMDLWALHWLHSGTPKRPSSKTCDTMSTQRNPHQVQKYRRPAPSTNKKTSTTYCFDTEHQPRRAHSASSRPQSSFGPTCHPSSDVLRWCASNFSASLSLLNGRFFECPRQRSVIQRIFLGLMLARSFAPPSPYWLWRRYSLRPWLCFPERSFSFRVGHLFFFCTGSLFLSLQKQDLVGLCCILS